MRTRLVAYMLAAVTTFAGCHSADRSAPATAVAVNESTVATGSAAAPPSIAGTRDSGPQRRAEPHRPSVVAPGPSGRATAPTDSVGGALQPMEAKQGGKGASRADSKIADGTMGIDADATRGDTFTDHGRNAWTDTAADAQSTFAADVDTASFTIARRMLREGSLPPAAAVRVEEFVNYFKYGYDTSSATSDRPFAVQVDGAASPWTAGRQLIRVGVASRAKPSSERAPANLVFLVDVSGSMQSPDKLELAKRSLRILVDNLKDGDTVALVTYAGRTEVVLPATGLEHKGEILNALDGLTSGGGTAMQSGLQLAYAEAAKGLKAGVVSRVIVLSDGDANIGGTTHDQLLAAVSAEVKKGVTLSTVGFGQGNYQDTTMEQLADKGNGNASYIDSLSTAKRVFATYLGSTLEVVAKDVKLQVEFDPKLVGKYRLVGYENRDIADELFRDDKVDAGEIGAGHQVTALYEVELTPAGRAASAAIATVRVRHKAPTSDTATEAAFPVTAGAVLGALPSGTSDLRLAVAAGAFADVLRGGADAQAWSLASIRALAAGTDATPDRLALLEMIDQAIALRGGAATGGATIATP